MKYVLIKLMRIQFILAIFFITACTTHPVVEPERIQKTENKVNESKTEVNPEALKHFMDGEVLKMQGNFPMAILEYQDALDYDPSSPTILTSLADAYMRIGKFEKAEKFLHQALEYNPREKSARELLGHQYLLRNQIKLAEEQYQLLHEFYPEDVEYLYILAEISLRQGDAEKAKNQLLEIYEKNPEEEQALFRAGEIAREQKDFSSALNIYEQLIKLNPNNIKYWRTYSEIALLLQDVPKAIIGLEKLLELTNNAPEVLERLSILYYDHNFPEKADSILNRLYESEYKSPGVLYYLGRMAMDKRKYELMEKYSKELVDTYPDVKEGYTNLALAYINLDRNLDAITILLEGRERFPNDYAVNFLLGNSYSQQENYVLAEKSLLTALKVIPDSRPALHLLATVYNHLEDWEHSDKIYEDLLSSNIEDSQALNNYSYTLAVRGIRLDEALKMALKANELEPENAAYLDTMGWIYFKMMQYEKAVDLIKQSLSIDGENVVVLEHMGDVLIKLNRVNEAIEYYKHALEIDPDNESLKEKLDIQNAEVE